MMENKKNCFQADSHVHSEYSHDSVCPVSKIYQAAREKGINLVCITDHCDLHPEHKEAEILAYRKQAVEGIAAAAANCTDVEILTGVELGGGFIRPELAKAVVNDQAYDMVIGSVHGIMFRGVRQSTGKFDFGSADKETMLAFFDQHLDATRYVAENLDIDVLAHLTYILRYINGKHKLNLDWHIQEEKIRKILRALIRRKIALEINTSCVGSDYDVWIPDKEIVDFYIQMGGRLFTLGSDTHKAEKLANGFEEAKSYLRQKGIAQLVYYKKRKPQYYDI